MAQIQTVVGTPPGATTPLPKFTDIYPSKVDPRRVTLIDTFTKVRATLSNAVPDFADAGQKWSSDAAFVATPGVDDGYVSGSGTQILSLGGVNGKVYIRGKWKIAASYFGMYVRLLNANNYFRISLSHIYGGIAVERRISGVTTVIMQVARPRVIDQMYEIGCKFVGDTLTVFLDNEVIGTVVDAAHSTATNVGIGSSSALHQFHEFVAGRYT